MLRQFDVARIADGTLVVVLQCDLVDTLALRVVAPLVPAEQNQRATRGLNPTLMVGEAIYRLKPELMAAVPVSDLGPRISNLGAAREEILRALDLLFTGV